MATTLHVETTLYSYIGDTCVIQHEGGQTFYTQFKQIEKKGFWGGKDLLCAKFIDIPGGNYVVTHTSSLTGRESDKKKIVTVFSGQETTLNY